MVAALVVLLAVTTASALLLAVRALRASRERFIRSYTFPNGLLERLGKVRPELQFKDIALTSHALRQFFLAHLRSGRRYVSMPSQVADDLWHEFILHTRSYEVFCRQAFGRFLHHTPAVALGPDRGGNAGLRRTWWWCCREENIDPVRPSRLPLLFALDTKLKIAGGFAYAADCGALPSALKRRDDGAVVYCGSDFSSSGFDGSVDGFGAGDGHHSHGGADGHGSSGGDGGSGDGGGSGCGGGCGGGD